MSDNVTKILKGTNEITYKFLKKLIMKVKTIIFINQSQTQNIIDKLKSLIDSSEKPKVDFKFWNRRSNTS